MKNNIFLITATLLSVAGCQSLKPTQNELADGYVSLAYSQSGKEVVPDLWWQAFNSTELNQLMEEAFSGNLSLAQYAARLHQQEALARKAGANKRPTLTASAQSTWTDITKSSATDSYSIGLSASYELDLWGRIKNTTEAELHNLNASELDLQSAQLSLSANIANTWLSIIAQTQQMELLNQQFNSNSDYLDHLKNRQKKGLATALEIYQQQQVVESTRALIPSAELQLELQKLQLAVLLGRDSTGGLELQTQALPTLTPLPDAGLPADLLEKRPDVKAEFERLKAKNNSVAAARANRLPAITLSGSLTASDNSLSEVINNWAGNLAAGLAAPLIDGEQRKAETDYQLARVEESVALYRETVLTAASEVEEALLSEQKIGEQFSMQKNQLTALEQQLAEARLRHRCGMADYLSVLSALASKQSLERTLISTELQHCTNRVELYRALGGGMN